MERAMFFVITRLCQDCVDGSCVAVGPISDCIVERREGDAAADLPNQLLINPDECIHCGLCAPECPWEAIFAEDDVPAQFHADIALNALSTSRPHDFVGAS